VKRRIALASLVLLAATAIYLAWFSSVFDVRSVRVFGTHYTTRTEVLRVAKVELGQPIARINAAAVEERVAALRPVASVEVRLGFPHSIVIEVHERVAIAAAADVDGSWWLVDRTGLQFEQVAQQPDGLIDVQGYTEQFRGIGARTAASFPRWLQLRVKTVTVYAPEDVRLSMKNGKSVMWGGESRAARKAEVLFALLQIRARFYDVSAPDAPATRA
jgi:cell division protein FtsQ